MESQCTLFGLYRTLHGMAVFKKEASKQILDVPEKENYDNVKHLQLWRGQDILL